MKMRKHTPVIVQAMLVDPIYEVNPATALVDLVTKLILHPLSRYVDIGYDKSPQIKI